LLRYSEDQHRDPDRVETDAQGRFTFDPVSAGGYLVTAFARGWATGTVTVVKSEGRAAEANVHLERGGTIRGRVLDAKGAPSAGWIILAMPEADEGRRTMLDRMIEGEYKSGSDGTFEIAGVSGGRYSLQLAAPEARTARSVFVIASAGDKDVELRLIDE